VEDSKINLTRFLGENAIASSDEIDFCVLIFGCELNEMVIPQSQVGSPYPKESGFRYDLEFEP
jgi:hypothetical protein